MFHAQSIPFSLTPSRSVFQQAAGWTPSPTTSVSRWGVPTGNVSTSTSSGRSPLNFAAFQQATSGSGGGGGGGGGGTSGGLTFGDTLTREIQQRKTAEAEARQVSPWDTYRVREAVKAGTVPASTAQFIETYKPGDRVGAPLAFETFKQAAPSTAPKAEATFEEPTVAPPKQPLSQEDMFKEAVLRTQEGDLINPFQKDTEAYNMYEQMQGILLPLRRQSDEQIKRRESQRDLEKKFIEQQTGVKSDILGRQELEAQQKRQAGIEKVRSRGRLAEQSLEEGRKKALRFLRGALAQRGALDTTGTGKFNVAALTGQYDIKNSELRQNANEQIQDMELKFEEIFNQIQNNRLLNETEKTRLMLELDRNTDNAIDSIMTNLSNQEVQLSGQAFSLARQEEREKAERQRQKEKELLDYLARRIESGETVNEEDIKYVTKGDAVTERFLRLAAQTGRESVSKGVTSVYEALLGGDWTTKVNPATGNTYKDEHTTEVARLVSQEGFKLEDALNRVRAAIMNSPEYRKLQAAKFATGGGGGTTSNFQVYRSNIIGKPKTYMFDTKTANWIAYDPATNKMVSMIDPPTNISRVDTFNTSNAIVSEIFSNKANLPPLGNPFPTTNQPSSVGIGTASDR